MGVWAVFLFVSFSPLERLLQKDMQNEEDEGKGVKRVYFLDLHY